MIKKCTKCGVDKEDTEFVPKKNCCKDCMTLYQKEYREKNRERFRLRAIKYREDNPEKLKERKKLWYKENRDRLAENKKEAYQKKMQEDPDYNKRRYRESATAKYRAYKASITRYGITVEVYEAMAKSQDYRCLICGAHIENMKGRNGNRLNIDHDHQTGEIRGLLCPQCNAGLGCFKDSKELLIRALEYMGTRITQ
jgi:hypothetical protein